MFISTIIPTIGRPTLARAVFSALEQGFQQAECEVIVVNDSGSDLPVENWQKFPNVQIISTNRRNRSIARNAGAAIATGKYLHFLDDDDWILPGAFESFWEAARQNTAIWIYGAFHMVNNDGETIVTIFPDEHGNCLINLFAREWLPLQASIVEASTFFKVGGFVMLETLKGGFEDIHLSRQIAQQCDFASISRVVACIRSGNIGSTTDYENLFHQDRESREQMLGMPSTFRRLIASTRNNSNRDAYWYGKVIYYYLGSAALNLKEKRLFTATSRGFYAIACVILASKYLLSADFWKGVTTPHYPRVWRTATAAGKRLFTKLDWK